MDDLPGDLKRRCTTRPAPDMLFARSDPGNSLLMSKARGTVKQLDRAGTMSVHFVEAADHTFSRRAPAKGFWPPSSRIYANATGVKLYAFSRLTIL